MDEKNLVKVGYFESDVKLIKVITFERVKAETIGVRFADKWGYVNRLTFVEVSVGDGSYVESKEQKILDNSSYGFAKDYKNSGVQNGDICLALSLVLGHPLNEEIRYRKWIFQTVLPLVEKTTPITTNGRGDTIIPVGEENSGSSIEGSGEGS